MQILFRILFGFLLVSVIVILIAQNRHPVKTLAWILLLFFLPVVGLVLYFFLGINKSRERLVSEEKLGQLKQKTLETAGESIIHDEIPEDNETANLLRMINHSYVTSGNSVRFYTAFDPMEADLIEDIRNARHHIHFQFFIIKGDRVGREVGEALAAKAREGVKVRVQFDDAANLTPPKRRFYRWLRKQGVQVQPFIKILVPFISNNTNYRNHRKVVVIDGKIGYAGGMNIADRYSDGIHGGIWRDTHFRVEGPAVSELQTSFLADWHFSTKEFLSSEDYYPVPKTFPDGIKMQIATSGPMDQWHVIMQGMLNMIAQSDRYIYVETPYFIPSETIMMSLRNAALSGLDVRIIVPETMDRGVLTGLATHSYIEPMLVAGARIFFYRKGFMHAKTIVVDDKVSTVGSTNIDNRSFDQDFEINGFFYDVPTAIRLKEDFLRDQEDSVEITFADWSKRNKIQRFKESLARLFSPLL